MLGCTLVEGTLFQRESCKSCRGDQCHMWALVVEMRETLEQVARLGERAEQSAEDVIQSSLSRE